MWVNLSIRTLRAARRACAADGQTAASRELAEAMEHAGQDWAPVIDQAGAAFAAGIADVLMFKDSVPTQLPNGKSGVLAWIVPGDPEGASSDGGA